MTTVYKSSIAANKPNAVGTHVFIIGVGRYPALVGGDPERLIENPLGLRQLTSPPVSARALADWFLGSVSVSKASTGFHNPTAPLATVQMLLSPGQTFISPEGREINIDEATRSNIAKCFSNWKECAAGNAANIAVFYFCGHGVMGVNDYLLPSDFGDVNRDNPWVDAIDITQTARAMRRLAGGSLYFFIDACRQASGDAVSPGANPPALAYVDFKKPVQGYARLILWAAGEGQEAFGSTGKESRFTSALIKALSGYVGEYAPDGNNWMVTGSLLSDTVSTILEKENAPLKPQRHQHVEQQLIGSQPFHFENRQPRLVFKEIPTSWSVGPEVRHAANDWPSVAEMPDEIREPVMEELEARPRHLLTQEPQVPGTTTPTEPEMLSVKDYFEVVLPAMLRWKSDVGARIQKSVRFDLIDRPGESWTVKLTPPVPTVIRGKGSNEDLLIRITSECMQSILRGDFQARKAIADGDIELYGDLGTLKTVGSFFAKSSDTDL